MSSETYGLSVDTLLDLILMKLPEEARNARYCSDSEVCSVAVELYPFRNPLTRLVTTVSEA